MVVGSWPGFILHSGAWRGNGLRDVNFVWGSAMNVAVDCALPLVKALGGVTFTGKKPSWSIPSLLIWMMPCPTSLGQRKAHSGTDSEGQGFLGEMDVLGAIRNWLTPEERYGQV
jgi:hypothetical protein